MTTNTSSVNTITHHTTSDLPSNPNSGRNPATTTLAQRGTVEQDGAVTWDERNTTRRRYRSWEELLGALRDHNTLLAGTLYATGTVLTPLQTVHLRERDRMTINIEGIGRLRNHVVDV